MIKNRKTSTKNKKSIRNRLDTRVFPKWVKEFIKEFDLEPRGICVDVSMPIEVLPYPSDLEPTGQVIVTLKGYRAEKKRKKK